MKYQNITLSIPKEVLREAKQITIERSAEALGSKVIWSEDLTQILNRYLLNLDTD
ncbi:MAG: hypothetical protein XD63_1684 [Thermoanaerobacterales bacterium 50_218]|nr:MAG: hypothetical protein XD63_1684 [Thermoanaerobacterales bacterium 50_218]